MYGWHKEYPFPRGVPGQRLQTGQEMASIFQLYVDQRWWIIKEFRGHRFDPCFPAVTETAFWLNWAYRLIDRHYPDQVVPTQFLVAKGQRGKPTVFIIQPKIEGQLGATTEALEALFETWDRFVQVDPAWTQAPEWLQEKYQACDIGPANVITTTLGQVMIIDW